MEMAFDRCRMAEAAKEQVRVIERSGEGSVEAVRVTKESHQSRSPERSQGKCSRCRRESVPGVDGRMELGVVLPLARHVILARVLVIFQRCVALLVRRPRQPVSVEDEVFAIGPLAEGVPDAQKNASALVLFDGPGAS